jgi:hypothetical protein
MALAERKPSKTAIQKLKEAIGMAPRFSEKNLEMLQPSRLADLAALIPSVFSV